MRRRKLVEIVAAKRIDSELARHERWPRQQLLAYQRDRVDAIVRHAAASSAFYAERFRGLVPKEGHVDLQALPAVDKQTFVERFDDIVTDPSLRSDELLAHVEAADADVLYRDRYRVIATSGSSGRKALFVYDRPAWAMLMGGFLRFNRLAGAKPSIPRRKLAYIGASGGTHMSRRISSSLDVGMHRILNLSATMPMPRIVDELNRFQPDIMPGFPSLVAALAEEQLAGRLRISPGIVSTSSELRTAEMTATIKAAWGVDPFDLYGVTESGMLACECDRHHGMHLFEDLAVVEVVDADGRPVPDGDVGDQILVTSLDNRTQPTIRLAVSDRVAIDPDPCPCGLSLPLLRSVEGRADDIIQLPSGNGRLVAVHPMHFAPVAKAREVREFQVVQEGSALNVRVVLHPDADARGLERRLAGELAANLRELGVAEPMISVKPCERLARDAATMGKLRLVVADSRR
ncbi:MAG: phenylacetate--CoA ligase family protein [Thermoleophilaceae bacterium]|nr:phenylacetate--CoA ligase family protein [Thermoleophilaceae bacterium]